MAASMAHEIRNPLTAILGFLKIFHKQISIQYYQKISSYLESTSDNRFLIDHSSKKE
ncbi:histidine kinase dimerization/phospho-acceptor domain-containing protein [Paenibacillus andongensis]|uniref:histidine kinase dimerization/phospho-acceptor domain-containing protein n=1 Tax=Paenibacillus andongensis TaxID=2975482 RepID=UPI0021BA8008|nr:histidine kinase dimerization/phospho-acceptor domain-containing protein [Paenibacillus andongensis]